MTDELKKQYVSIDLARKLKELGYPQRIDEDDEDYDYLSQVTMIRFSDEPDNIMSYEGADVQAYLDDWYQKRHNFETFVAPSYYQTMLWLIEKYNTHVMLTCECRCDSYGNVLGHYYDYDVRRFYPEHENTETRYGIPGHSRMNPSMTYSEALEAGVRMALEWLMENNEEKSDGKN